MTGCRYYAAHFGHARTVATLCASELGGGGAALFAHISTGLVPAVLEALGGHVAVLEALVVAVAAVSDAAAATVLWTPVAKGAGRGEYPAYTSVYVGCTVVHCAAQAGHAAVMRMLHGAPGGGPARLLAVSGGRS